LCIVFSIAFDALLATGFGFHLVVRVDIVTVRCAFGPIFAGEAVAGFLAICLVIVANAIPDTGPELCIALASAASAFASTGPLIAMPTIFPTVTVAILMTLSTLAVVKATSTLLLQVPAIASASTDSAAGFGLHLVVRSDLVAVSPALVPLIATKATACIPAIQLLVVHTSLDAVPEFKVLLALPLGVASAFALLLLRLLLLLWLTQVVRGCSRDGKREKEQQNDGGNLHRKGISGGDGMYSLLLNGRWFLVLTWQSI